MKTWFSRLGISVPPSGTAVTMSGDSLTVIGSPRVSAMAGGVLHCGLDQHASRALTERTPREIVGQLQIEMICAIGVRLSLRRTADSNRPRHPCRRP